MKIKNILISQNAPADFERSPYAELTKKYSVKLDFFKLFQLEGVSATDFRKSKINIAEHSAVIFSSKNTIDYFFQLLKELRTDVPDNMKYFCTTEAAALYLQNYIQFRKRKVFFTKNNLKDFYDQILKNKEDRFLLPSGAEGISTALQEFLDKAAINYSKAVIFKNIPCDLKKNIDIKKYQMVVFFSPFGVQSLKYNFPDLDTSEIIFGALGENAAAAVEAEGWSLQVVAPTKATPSITAAMDVFLKEHATRKR